MQSDRIIKEGFPEGWYIQDRPGENIALLCRARESVMGGPVCICLRPGAISTDRWLPTARLIASGFELATEPPKA